jgi:aerobic-type carbon monoxide dehydrogenase small subunit (CoxS/CutS family)
MNINSFNNQTLELDIHPGDSLLKVLRGQGFFGVKHGCETGECGACAADGKPVNACLRWLPRRKHAIQTIEAQGEHPQQGWRETCLHARSGLLSSGQCSALLHRRRSCG